MLTLISTLVGFFSAGLPGLLKLYQDKLDKAHELQIMQLQLEMAKNQLSLELQEIQMQTNSAETLALYSTAGKPTNWLIALNASVRPVICYSFLTLYIALKLPSLKLIFTMIYQTDILSQELGLLTKFQTIHDMMWSQEDMAILGAIIAFYFSSRAFNFNNN